MYIEFGQNFFDSALICIYQNNVVLLWFSMVNDRPMLFFNDQYTGPIITGVKV